MGHTNYDMVRLMPDKTATECTEAVASMRSELRTMSKDPTKDLVRVHSDDDPSFKKELKAYLVAEGIRPTHTGGYRPTNNSRTERRIRTINEAFRATLLVATGGLAMYESLWGLGLTHDMHCSNSNVWTDDRCPYKALTGKDYEWGKRDLVMVFHTLLLKSRRSSAITVPVIGVRMSTVSNAVFCLSDVSMSLWSNPPCTTT